MASNPHSGTELLRIAIVQARIISIEIDNNIKFVARTHLNECAPAFFSFHFAAVDRPLFFPNIYQCRDKQILIQLLRDYRLL